MLQHVTIESGPRTINEGSGRPCCLVGLKKNDRGFTSTHTTTRKYWHVQPGTGPPLTGYWPCSRHKFGRREAIGARPTQTRRTRDCLL